MIYGVEIVGNTAYTETVDRTETVFGKQRNNFEGTKDECIEYIKRKGCKEVFGVLEDSYQVEVMKM